jgi:hypothetical protein
MQLNSMILICATASRQENCLRGGTASIKGLKNGWRVERGFTCMSVWAEVIRTVSQVEQCSACHPQTLFDPQGDTDQVTFEGLTAIDRFWGGLQSKFHQINYRFLNSTPVLVGK